MTHIPVDTLLILMSLDGKHVDPLSRDLVLTCAKREILATLKYGNIDDLIVLTREEYDLLQRAVNKGANK